MIAPRLRLPYVRSAIPAGRRAVLILAVVQGGCGDEANSQVVGDYRPDAGVVRLADAGLHEWEVHGLAVVTDFDMAGDRMVVLDMRGARVVLLERAGGSWAVAAGFGRHGSGPGEFNAPQSVSFRPDGGIVVVDDDGLHRFDGDGRHVMTWPLDTPCTVSLPRVRATPAGHFVTGNCVRSGGTADTVLSVLYWSADGRGLREIARETRYTSHSRDGFPLSSMFPFSDGGGGHLFGVGLSNCIHRIDVNSARPRAERLCELARTRYSAPPPPALARRLERERERRPEARGLLEWPAALPWYMDALSLDGETVLLRPFTADSVVFEIAPHGEEVLVAPFDGLVSCRAGGCLFARQGMDGVRLTLLELGDFVQLRGRRRP